MQEKIQTDLSSKYYRELSSMDIFNPYKSDEGYLRELGTYFDRVDVGIKSGEMQWYLDMTNELNEKTRNGAEIFWKWLFYDVAKYASMQDKTNILVNHTAYDPFPFSILGNDLKKQGQFELVEKVLGGIVVFEQRNFAFLQKQFEKKREDADFVKVYEKTRRSLGRLWSDIAFAQMKIGKLSRALLLTEKIISLDPTDVFAYGLKAQALIGLQRYEEALTVTEKIISLDPTDVIAYGLKAQALIGLQRYEEALTVTEKKISLDPTDVIAYGLKAQALIGLQRYEEATESLNTLDENVESVLWLKSKCLAMLGQLKDAKQSLVALLFRSYSQGYIKKNYVEAYLAIINQTGYEMDANEKTLMEQLEKYFGEDVLRDMLNKKETYNWNTPIQETDQDRIYSKAFYNPVFDGTYTTAVNKDAKNITGAPVQVKNSAPARQVVVERRRPKRVIVKK